MCFLWYSYQIASIGSVNNLVAKSAKRWHMIKVFINFVMETIICGNKILLHQRIYAAQGGNELI